MADPVKRICDELGVCTEEALCYLDGFQWNFESAWEACRIQALPLPLLTVESSPVKEKSPIMIDSLRSLNLPDEQSRNHCIELFCETAAGANLEEAHAYLERSNWNLDLAVGYFFDERRRTPSQKNLYPQGKPLRLVSKRLKIESSSSDSMEVDSTGEHIPEAIPLMVSSQVKGKAVEEDSSTETFPDHVAIKDGIILGPRASRTTITITIFLADGGSVNLPFSSIDTVKDIRDAIDELTPDNDRDYFLLSMPGEEYMDSNITVNEISTTLLQIYLDP